MAGKQGRMLGKGSAKGLKFAAVVSVFNHEHTSRLHRNAKARLRELGHSGALQTVEVPGAFELGFAARLLAASGNYDAVLCLGAVIRGKTGHYDLVCKAAQEGILRAGLDSGVPCIFGVLTCETPIQALERSQGGPLDAGRNAADAAVRMALLAKKLGRGR